MIALYQCGWHWLKKILATCQRVFSAEPESALNNSEGFKPHYGLVGAVGSLSKALSPSAQIAYNEFNASRKALSLKRCQVWNRSADVMPKYDTSRHH